MKPKYAEYQRKYNKKYKLKNKEKLKEKNKQYVQNNKEKIKKAQKKYRQNNKEKIKKGTKQWVLKTYYNITYEQYLQLSKKQNYVCAICNQPETKKFKNKIISLSVDHIHLTNPVIVRGLLCNSCNGAIGSSKESICIITNAITYLQNKQNYFIKSPKISSPRSLGMRAKKLMYHYHITLDKYNEMLEEQNYVCKICNKPETRIVKGKLLPLCIDHKDNIIRGLLCNNCNVMLGHFKDNVRIMKETIKYLKKYKKNK